MRVRWTRRALSDLDRLAAHIAADKPLAAAGFVAAVVEKADKLARFPLLGRVGALADTRELVVHRHYLLTYRVRVDEVQILQVWHTARRRD